MKSLQIAAAALLLGNFCLATAVSAAPVNDNLANATVIAAEGGVVNGTSVDATKESGEPDHVGFAGGASVWWSWTPDVSGRAGFTTEGSSYDTLMAIYTGAGYPLTLVTENDDEDVGLGITTSRASFDAVAGTTYRIAIDGFNGLSGNITLECIPMVEGPANDNVADAAVITGATGEVMATNVDATKETGELDLAGSAGGSSVWWSWTAPASGVVNMDTNGSTFDTIMGAYTGSAHPLTLVVENDDGNSGTSSEIMFTASSGTTYFIVVDGYDGGTGSITLNWSMPTPAVTAVNRMNPSPTNASTVQFGVTFSKSVTGVDQADFSVTASGVSGASVATVTGSGSSYTVTVNTGSGDGTVRLDVIDNDSIKDTGNVPLGGTGAGNGSFTSGQSYTIDKTAPVVDSIEAISGTVVDIVFTESGALSNSILTAANYSVTGDGKGTVGDHPATVVLQSDKTYRLTWNSGSMINGQSITITVGNVQDAAGNLIGTPNSGSNLALPVTLSAFTIE